MHGGYTLYLLFILIVVLLIAYCTQLNNVVHSVQFSVN